MTGVRGYRVSRSTCQLILDGRLLPTQEQLTALLAAFDVTEAASSGWRSALNRIAARRHPTPIWPGGCVCPDGNPAVMVFLERRDRDESIKRRTGQLRQDEDYDEWLEARVARAFYQRRWDYLDEDDLTQLERGEWHSERPSANSDSLW
ncbi:hypothetical protein [Streptomyces rimosus]|uniref:hypothetical protein n=1 Tax=Streptomyces rimosus TaxID=1927 RepID=UPI0037D48762